MKPERPPSSTEDLAHSIKETGALESNSGDKGAVPGKTQCKERWSTESAEVLQEEGSKEPLPEIQRRSPGANGVSSTPPSPGTGARWHPRAGSPAPRSGGHCRRRGGWDAALQGSWRGSFCRRGPAPVHYRPESSIKLPIWVE